MGLLPFVRQGCQILLSFFKFIFYVYFFLDVWLIYVVILVSGV